MRSADYVNIAIKQVIPSMHFLFPDGTEIFQDNNGRIHQTQTVKERFWERQASCSHMDWP